MPDFTQKARGCPEIESRKTVDNSAKTAFFSEVGGRRAEKPRKNGPIFAKSLSVEQFLCTKPPFFPTFSLLTPTKKKRSPTKKNGSPTFSRGGQFLLLHFLRALFQNRGGAIRSESVTYPKNTPKTTPYISDSPPPPENHPLPDGLLFALEVVG